MDLEINERNENKLFQREEIRFIVTADKTPQREEIKGELCRKLNLNPENTIVIRIDQLFGSKASICMAHSYPNSERLNKFEPKHLLDRIKRANKAAKGEAATEEKAAATPAPQT